MELGVTQFSQFFNSLFSLLRPHACPVPGLNAFVGCFQIYIQNKLPVKPRKQLMLLQMLNQSLVTNLSFLSTNIPIFLSDIASEIIWCLWQNRKQISKTNVALDYCLFFKIFFGLLFNALIDFSSVMLSHSSYICDSIRC